MDREKVLGILHRIKKSPEWPEFEEYLQNLSKHNYERFKRDLNGDDRIYKGYAIAIDNLMQSFEECDKPQKSKRIPDRT